MADNGQSGIPQVTDAVPINPSPVTPEERLEYTRKLLQGVHLPQPMAPDFDPVAATPEQLRQHGLPPRPSADVAPKDFARWEKMVTELRGCELVRPGFKIIQHDVASGSQKKKRYEAQTWKKNNWAGAVIAESVFDLVQSDWTVPQPEAGRGDHEAWYSSAYVGLDGYRENSNEVLAGGTGHDYYKSRVGGTYMTYAWFEWYPAYPVMLEDFPVRPGDRVWCDVWGYLPQDNKKGSFCIYNMTTKKYAALTFPAPIGVWLHGDSAEWIVEGEEPEANFHVVEFDSCYAQKTSGRWYDVSSATTVMSTCEDGTVCTATIEGYDTVVVMYGGGKDK
ncbi:hypothetical protein MY11210_008003 [Beauveria gryllotalpidicola]